MTANLLSMYLSIKKMSDYLFGTTTGDVLLIEGENKHEAWSKACSLGWSRDELNYHGFLGPHLDGFEGKDRYSTV